MLEDNKPPEPVKPGQNSLSAGQAALWLTLYFPIALMALWLSNSPMQVATLWYANAWATSFFVTQPYRRWGALSLIVVVASVVANLTGGATLGLSAAFTVPNLVEIALASTAIKQLNLWPYIETSVNRFIRFLLIGCVFPAVATSVVAGLVIPHPTEGFGLVAIRWIVGSLIGSVSLLPLRSSFARTPGLLQTDKRFGVRAGVGVVFSVIMTLLAISYINHPFTYIVITLVIIALKLPFYSVTLATFASVLTTSIAVTKGIPLFTNSFTDIWSELTSTVVIVMATVPALLISVYVETNQRQAREIMERKARLRHELQQRRLLFDNSSEGIAIVRSPDFRITGSNKQLSRLLGYTSAELELLSFTDFLSDMDEAEFRAKLVPGTNRITVFTATLKGRTESFIAEISAVEAEWQDASSWMLNCRNVSEQIASEQRIQALLDFSQKILNISPAGVLVYNSNGQCILSNPAAERITGIPMQNLRTQNFYHIEAWKESGMLDRAIEALETDATTTGVTHITTSAEKNVWLEFYFKSFEEAGEKRLLLLMSDDTLRMQTQLDLEQTRKDLQQILDGIPSLVGYWDRHLRNRFANKAYYKWVNAPAGSLTGREMRDVLGEEAFAEVYPYVQRVLQGEVQTFERTVLENSHWRNVLINYIPDRSDDQCEGFYVLVHDISEVKQAEAKLREALNTAREAQRMAEAASEAKSDFVANMSHEIRTPLNAVIGLAQLMHETPLNETQKSYLSTIQSSSRALLHVLNDILDFAKIEAGRLSIEELPFNIEDMLATTADLFAVTAANKGIELLIDIAPEVPEYVTGDALRTGQILNNLVGNAVKFTSRGEILIKVVLLKWEDERVWLQFSVRDTGIGLSSNQVAHLFDPFMQADSSTTRRYGGTGLGLTISKRLVELMNGTISVESELDYGSTFTFSAEFSEAPQQRPELTLEQLRGKRTLLVDDHPISCRIIERLLMQWGLDVDCTQEGQAALRKVEEASAAGKPVELLLLDWKMPRMDGLEVLSLLEAMHNNGTVPQLPMIIIITEADRMDVLSASGGTVTYPVITKPVTPSRLFDAIATLSGHRSDQVGRLKSTARIPLHERTHLLAGMRILLVEDNLVNQQVASEILRRMGVIVSIAGNGQEALDKARRQEFDLVLMDLQMPGIDGFETTRILRSRPEGKDIPILAMTASALPEDKLAAKSAGMDGHITKPIDIDVLLTTLLKFAPEKDVAVELPTVPVDVLNIPAELPPHIVLSLQDLQQGGVDVGFALKQFYNDHNFLIAACRTFAKSFGNFCTNLQEAVEAKNDPAAQALVHTLKGSSGSIGATMLYNQSIKAEQELSQGQWLATQALVPGVEKLLHAINEISAVSETAPTEYNPAEYAANLEELYSALQRNIVPSHEHMQFLKSLTHNPEQAIAANAIIEALDAYDFERARELVGKLKVLDADAS